jgi:hypothetical protein
MSNLMNTQDRQASATLPLSPAPTTHATPIIHGTATPKMSASLLVHSGAVRGAVIDAPYVHQPNPGTAGPKPNVFLQAQTGAAVNTAGAMIMTVQPVPKTNLGTATLRVNVFLQAQTGAAPLIMGGVILMTVQPAQSPSLGTAGQRMTAMQLAQTGAAHGARSQLTTAQCSMPKAWGLLRMLPQDALK